VYEPMVHLSKSGSTWTDWTGVRSPQVSVPQLSVDDHVGSAAVLFASETMSRARSDAISKIQRIKMNVAQNVAEFRQVQNMFRSNARRIANAYRALRHGNISGFAREIPLRERHQQSLLRRGPLDVRKHAPSIWLETQYGWVPLLGDIYTGITRFYQRVEEGYPIRAIGTGRSTRVSKTRLDTSVGIVNFNDTSVYHTRAKVIIEYEVDFSRLVNMSSWGLTNPLLLAWELVPYSFVFDWFLPVGDWLSQVGYSTGLYFKRGMESVVGNAMTTRRFKRTSNAPSGSKVSGTDYFESVRFNRRAIGSFPSPGRPRFDADGLRGRRIINALSLLALAFDRTPPRKRY